ncbi:hypothetical protein BB560_006072 [Smittium megazygosporum]|uniref:chitin synthase n=1 Tax=Smittium megazygosporum TaxID=133381 RepID=A0A2T9YIV0_9FUNG|nr:hypothetical protein BB560_006072 [Smittium megazygosporum]
MKRNDRQNSFTNPAFVQQYPQNTAFVNDTDYNNIPNSRESSDLHFNQGVGFGSRSTQNIQPSSPLNRKYNTGTIKRKIVETDKHGFLSLEKPPSEKVSSSRKFWLFICYLLTFLIPDFVIGWTGKKLKQEKVAWREKVALCMFIFLSWVIVLFIIIGLGWILCPKRKVYTAQEVLYHDSPDDAYTSIRGTVYEITNFVNKKHGAPLNPTKEQMLMFAGLESNASFPIAVRTACPQLIDSSLDRNYETYLSSDPLMEVFQAPFQHKVGSVSGADELKDQDFFSKYVLPAMRPYKKGDLVWSTKTVNYNYKTANMNWRIINGEVFNLNDYFYTVQSRGSSNPELYNFLDSGITKLFDDGGAGNVDISKEYNLLNLSPTDRSNNYNCMKNLFYVGKVDFRESFKCHFTNYLLLAFAGVLVFVILIKFLAALQLGSKKLPPPQNKFVLAVVPCYTEGEASISRTINSLASLDYEDTKKLIFIVCDGNIVGTGNDTPTPRIVLDLLGVDPEYDPPIRDCLAIAEGPLQHNRCKVYSGLYDFEGHSVPFIVTVKVGNKFELKRPGNRGKRDSQLLVMRFLSKVHFNLPMSPLELDIYHHFQNILGVNPALYEFMFQIDADTEVHEDALRRLVSYCSADSSIAGICGETCLSNEQESWVTMIQVYEYFISHHMAKAFESIFGSVTCLPGCFCMYRIFDKKEQPILISPKIIVPYSERHVDTLHKKNLLSLGEDRYLTTLVLKHFSHCKLKFVRDAKCNTIAPNSFKVFISQRRRWINSTVHNLFELVSVSGLCGFCCFSMRFIVFLDLFGTITMPTVLIYFAYLIFIAVTNLADVGIISIIIIAAVYGLQAIIYIIRREWQQIGWMILYLLFFPLWSFVLPIYSFWHFDDFSWGNTRKVVGEKGKQIDELDDSKFDPESIPLMLWPDYENMLASQGLRNVIPENPNKPSSDAGSVSRPQSFFSTAPLQQRAQTSASHLALHTGYNSAVGGPASNMSTVNKSYGLYSSPMSPQPGQSIPLQQMQSFPQSPAPVLTAQTININPQVINGNQRAFAGTPPPFVGRSASPSAGFTLNQQQIPSSSLDYNTSRVSYMQQIPSVYNPSVTGRMTSMNYGAGTNMMDVPTDPSTLHQTFSPVPHPMSPTFSQAPGPQYPTEDQVYAAVQQIISTTDLNSISKKSIRDQLSVMFSVDMTPYKQLVNSIIDQILANSL